ncbi:hypothetical protein RYX36_032668 [Vicia faba]
MQQWKEFALGITTWAHEVSPYLYINTPKFGAEYQSFYDQNRDHVQVTNLREIFHTSTVMESCIVEQNQNLENRRAETRTLRARQNQHHQYDFKRFYDFCRPNDRF